MTAIPSSRTPVPYLTEIPAHTPGRHPPSDETLPAHLAPRIATDVLRSLLLVGIALLLVLVILPAVLGAAWTTTAAAI